VRSAGKKSRRGDKRESIVVAATALFNRYGFRRTSIDLLAAEAEVAKPTVYAYFPDKDAIFRAVVEAVCTAIHRAAEDASKTSAPLAERLTEMLTAKFTRHWELVHASPHAQELLDSQGRLGAEIIERADRSYRKLLARVLEVAELAGEIDTSLAGLSPASTALLLLRAASGAGYDATSTASHRKHVAEIVGVVLRSISPR
jgi:AcrR family transcriptional regulator